jgi:hypothetical protein
MTFLGFGRNSGGVRPPDDAELERRWRALGERYYELDRTPTQPVGGAVQPPAGLFQNAAEASDYLRWRARRTLGEQPLPIEAPTTAATVAEFRGGGAVERPPAEMGGGGGMVDGLLRGVAVRPERPPTERPAFDEAAADRALALMTGRAPAPVMRPVFDEAAADRAWALMTGRAPAPVMRPVFDLNPQPAERPPSFAPGASQGEPAAAQPAGELPPAAPGMVWKRNKRTGEYRQFAVEAGDRTDLTDRTDQGASAGEPPVPRKIQIQPRYSAAPATGAFRDEQIRAGLVQPGVGVDRERELRRAGLVQRAGNTMLSAAARAHAREELARMEREDAVAARQKLAETHAAAATAQAQAKAAGKSPVFNLPGGKQGVIVGHTLVDAETGALITDARKGGTLDPMLVMQITDPDRRAKLIESWVKRGGKVG